MRTLSGHTHHYAVLGHPIGHTLSPVMHQASFDALGLDAVYLAFDVHPDRLLTVLSALRDMGFKGVNLTVPLKEVAYQGFDNLDPAARMLGAVNTVEFTPAGMRGHNTDGTGFLKATAEAFGPCIQGATIFVLGTGGAGRAVALTCAVEGASTVLLADADPSRAEKVAKEMASLETQTTVDVCAVREAAEAVSRADLVVQSTPVGMKPEDPVLVDPGAFHSGQKVYDLIYMYPETPFLCAARTAGAQTANGLGMLLHQGARAFTIWTGREPSVAAMREALERAVYGT